MTISESRHIDSVSTAGLCSRIQARLFAAQLDRLVEARPPGAVVPAGSALAVHRQRLTSRAERDKLVHTLRHIRPPGTAVASLIGELCRRLSGPLPVHARGAARLRILLADRRGPFYRSGPGSLNAALRGVLAAL